MSPSTPGFDPLSPATPSRIEPRETPSGHASRIALRTLQMLYAAAAASVEFCRGALAGWLAGRRDPDALATSNAQTILWGAFGRALVRLASGLGATFIKIGQIASTRADLLPRPVVEELRALQDRVPPFPFEQVRRIVERELGQPIEAPFSEFEREPVAAASVAQVHRAVLREEGARVAIKVRRPDIVEKVALDRSILLFVARILERIVPSLRLISLEEAMQNFCHGVELQLDLAIEADNNRRFTRNFADDPEVCFPRLYPRWCSPAVLTMEFIEAVHEHDLEAHGIEVHRVVEAGMRAVCRMIFLHGFVHADLHPGNVRFADPGRVVLLDLGLVGELEDTDRLTTAQLLFAFATGDGKTVARLFYDNAPHKATPDYGAFEHEICDLVESLRSRGLANLQVTLEIGRIFDILRRHHVQSRAHMTMVNLALMTAEGMGKRLAPDLSLTDEALPYLREALGIALPPPRAST